MRISIAAFVAGIMGLLASPASAFFAQESSSGWVDFVGSGCGSTATAYLTVPSGVRQFYNLHPPVGARVRDLLSDQPVATVQSIDRNSGLLRWTVGGSDAACADPTLDWDAYVFLHASYRMRELLYSINVVGQISRKPSVIQIGASQVIRSLHHWRGWDSRNAKARGILPYNNCSPDCANGSITNIPVRVRMSNPGPCAGTYAYRRLDYRLQRSPNGHRHGGLNFGFEC